MSELRGMAPQSFEIIVGLTDTIRENLARIEAALPLAPLPLASGEAQREGRGARIVRHATGSIPAPKSLLAPGGRIPNSALRGTRRPAPNTSQR